MSQMIDRCMKGNSDREISNRENLENLQKMTNLLVTFEEDTDYDNGDDCKRLFDNHPVEKTEEENRMSTLPFVVNPKKGGPTEFMLKYAPCKDHLFNWEPAKKTRS